MNVENRADQLHTDTGAQALLVRSDGGKERVTRQILREQRLELVVNEQTVARLVCTPADLENFVVGRLVTERIISDLDDIEQLYICESGSRARVFLKQSIRLQAAVAEEPTCCTDNQVFLQPVSSAEVLQLPSEISEDGNVWKEEWVFALVNAFAQDSKLHKSTGGTHSCVLGVEGRVLYSVEDIGRHNAMDKAIGYAVRQGLDRSKCMLFTTGRVPTDMVSKVVNAGIPVLVSKAVPTREAVELAAKSGLTLICRAWPDSFEVY